MKKDPRLFDDNDIYSASSQEVLLALNARNIFDFNYGERFDETIVKKLGVAVGFLFHDENVRNWSDAAHKSWFSELSVTGVSEVLAIPTGYFHSRQNKSAMEVAEFYPPLIAKIKPTISGFSKILGGQIGLYSGKHYLFSKCLGHALLEFNGNFSMFLGPRDLIEKVVGASAEESWQGVRDGKGIDSAILATLRDAMKAYGYC